MRVQRFFSAGVVISAAFVAGLILPAQGGALPQPAPARAPSAGGLAGVPVPDLAWTPCQGAGFECTSMAVPLDYRNPTGTTIDVGVVRHRATDPANRIGAMVLHVGGPGGDPEGTFSFMINRYPEIAQRFDFYAPTPRGVNTTTPTIPLACPNPDRYRLDWGAARQRPTSGEFSRALNQAEDFGQDCVNAAGPLLPFLGTEFVARDFDVLRAAIGEDKWTYFGFSYGTYVGTVYANLFPQRLRAAYLDSAYDPDGYVNDPYEFDLRQYRAVEHATGRFLDWCRTNQGQCTFGGNDPRAAFAQLTASLDADPIEDASGAVVANGATLVFRVVFDFLGAGRSGWPALGQALAEAQSSRTGDLLAPIPLPPVPGFDETNFLGVNVATECADRRYPPGPDSRLQARLNLAVSQAPLTGRAFAYGPPSYDHSHATICTRWPVESHSRYSGPFNAPGAPPILVVGITGDPDTPYQDSVTLAETLDNGHLLTHDGEGHGALFRSPQCVDTFALAYLLNLALPAEGTTCRD